MTDFVEAVAQQVDLPAATVSAVLDEHPPDLSNVLDSLSAEKGGGRECLPSPVLAGREAWSSRRWLCRCGLGVVGEVEVGEVGLCPVGGELDCGLERFVEHERVAVKRGEAGEIQGCDQLLRTLLQVHAVSGLPPLQRAARDVGHAEIQTTAPRQESSAQVHR